MNDIARLWRDYQDGSRSNNVTTQGIKRQAFIAGCEAMRDLMNSDDTEGWFEREAKREKAALEDAGQQNLTLVPNKDE